SLPRSPGSRPAFPCRRCEMYCSGGSGVSAVAKDFFAGGVTDVALVGPTPSDSNSLCKVTLKQKNCQLRKGRKIHPCNRDSRSRRTPPPQHSTGSQCSKRRPERRLSPGSREKGRILTCRGRSPDASLVPVIGRA